jgi:hypothetical protein
VAAPFFIHAVLRLAESPVQDHGVSALRLV